MSFNLSIQFSTFEELEFFVHDMNKYKNWKSKQEKKKEKQTHQDIEINEQFTFTSDRRGMHQQAYHNQAKLYQQENPHLSYRDCLKFVYKNNKNDEKII
jgi:hypothetical protein